MGLLVSDVLHNCWQPIYYHYYPTEAPPSYDLGVPSEPNESISRHTTGQQTARGYTPSAMPSMSARVVAFCSIVLAGICGGLIGYALITLESDSTVLAGVAVLVGAVGSAVGVAVVATLSLRAMGEWRVIEHSREPDRH